MSSPKLIWDIGTGYDLFISLDVLHNPAHYGIRPAWTAGMRARLSAEHREILEVAQLIFRSPTPWVYSLPEPKDAATVLWHLSRIPAGERMMQFAFLRHMPDRPIFDMIHEVIASGHWSESQLKLLSTVPRQYCACEPDYTVKEARIVLNWYARAETFGERYLEALRAYYDVFFGEEEKRIRPALEEVLIQAQAMARRLSLSDLIEALTQGISLPHLLEKPIELVATPSFWSTPLIQYTSLDQARDLLIFGARPKHMSLIPGEVVPDMLIRTLKTLSEPTRLRILQHLTIRPMTPAQLARHLRLRPPTITHHIKALRLAGMIRITKNQNFESNSYSARPDMLAAVFDRLNAFLKGEDVHHDDSDDRAGQDYPDTASCRPQH